MAKPTFILIPGAWHTGEIYATTVEILKQHGYDAVALTLPSVGAEPAHQDWSQDVKYIQQHLQDLIEKQDKNVIVVSHSVNGLTAGEAVAGWSLEGRTQKRLKGGVQRLVYIMSLAMPEGFSCWSAEERSGIQEWIKLDEEKHVATVTPEDAKRVFYNDLDEAQAQHWIAKLQPQSEGSYTSKVTYAAWRHIPSTYVVARQDQSGIPPLVDYMVNQEKPNAFDKTEVHETAGHFPMISQPDWVAEVLRRAAGEQI